MNSPIHWEETEVYQWEHEAAFNESSRPVRQSTACLPSHPFLPFPCSALNRRRLHFPNSPALWLPDTFSHERLKVGRGEKLMYLSLLCFLEHLLQGSSPYALFQAPSRQPGSECVSQRGPRCWVQITPLSGSLRGVDDFHFCQFWGCLLITDLASLLLSFCVSNFLH